MAEHPTHITFPSWARWSVYALVTLLVLLLALRILAATPFGRGLVENRIEALEPSGQQIRIEGLGGDLLGTLTISELSVSDTQGAWLTANDVHLEWSPLALLGRRLNIDALDVSQIHVSRRPELVPNRNGNGSGEPLLRAYRLGALEVQSLILDEGVAGRQLAAALNAQLETTLETGQLTLDLRPEDVSGDAINGAVTWGGAIPLEGELVATGAQDGLLASLLAPTRPGPVEIRVSGEGSPDDWLARARMTIGDGQPLELTATGDGKTASVQGEADLSAFEAATDLTGFIGDIVQLSLDQGERLELIARSASGELRARTDWDSDARQPDLSAIDISAALTNRIQLSDGDITLAGASASGMADLSGDSFGFTGQSQINGLSLPEAAINTLTVPGSFRFSRDSRQLDINASATAKGFQAANDEVSAYVGQAPRLELKGRVDLPTGLLDIAALALTTASGMLEASGQLSADRDRINLTGRLSPAGQLGRAQGLTLGAGRFELSSAGDEAISGSGDLQLQFIESPHPLVDGPFRASLDARIDRDNALRIDMFNLLGERLRAQAEGRYTARQIDVSLTAEASEFADGDLRIGGALLTLEGQGTSEELNLTSRLDVPSANLSGTAIERASARFDGALTGRSLTGQFNAAATVDDRRARSSAFLEVSGDTWAVSSLDAALDALTLTGMASGQAGALSQARLNLSAPAGLLDGMGALSGTLDLDGEELAGTLTLDGYINDAVQLGDVSLSASGPVNRISGELSTAGQVRASGHSRDLELSVPFDVNTERREALLRPMAVIDGEDLRTLEPVRVSAMEQAILARGRLGLLGGEIGFDGAHGEDGVRLDVRAEGIDASVLARLAERPALRGTVNAEVSLFDEGPALAGTGNIALVRIAQARPDAPEVSGKVDLSLSTRDLTATINLQDGDDSLNLTGEAKVPVSTSLDPLQFRLSEGAKIEAELNGRGEIEPVWTLVGPVDTALEGQFELSSTFTGPLRAIAPRGRLTVREASLEDSLVGLHLEDLSLLADLSPDAIVVREVMASGHQGGTVSGGGRYEFGGSGTVDLTLDRLDALQREDLRVVASGNLQLEDAARGASLKGALRFDSAEVNVDQLPNGGYTTLDVRFPNGNGIVEDKLERPERLPIALDIELDADRRIRVIGGGLETEWRMDASLGGTARAPQLTGTAEIVRGDVNVLGRSFPLTGSSVRFNGPPDEAELAIRAQRTEDGFTAGFLVSGTIGSPEFSLTSSPEVPESEVLSRALFGTSPSQLSPSQAAQLAAGLAQLAGGGGGFDPIGGLEDALDVDRIDLGFGEDGAASLGAGKYVAEDVYLEVTTTTRGAPGLGVEWTPRDNVEVGAEFGTEVTPRFTIQWTRDYGGPQTPASNEPPPDSGEAGAPEN